MPPSPMTQAGERIVPQTDGKDVEMYHFIYQGKELLSTPFICPVPSIIPNTFPKLDSEPLDSGRLFAPRKLNPAAGAQRAG